MMLIQAIRYVFAPDDADLASDILGELRDLSVEEPGIVRFVVARSVDQPNVFVLWEEYVDEAALSAHQKTEHFERLAVGGIRRLAVQRQGDKARPLP